MSDPGTGNKRPTTIRDLYPRLSEEERIEAEENLTRYAELALRIYERITADPTGYAQFKSLTAGASGSTIGARSPDRESSLTQSSIP
jgi:hypothetical protein